MQPNSELIQYIKHQRNLGDSDLDITNALINAGWPEKDIRTAFDQSGAPASMVPQAEQEQRRTRRRKRLFIASLTITLLILAAVAVLALRTLSTPPIA